MLWCRCLSPRTTDERTLRVADLVDNDPGKRERVSAELKLPAQKNNRDHVVIIIALERALEGFDWLWRASAICSPGPMPPIKRAQQGGKDSMPMTLFAHQLQLRRVLMVGFCRLSLQRKLTGLKKCRAKL